MTSSTNHRFAAILLLAAACRARTPPAAEPPPGAGSDITAIGPSQPPPAADPAPPAFRLGDDVVPIRYSVELTLDPARDDFGGTVEIELAFRERTSAIWLHGRDLAVREATLSAAGVTHTARAIQAPDSLLGFALPVPVDVGPAKLRIVYGGKAQSVETAGIFRQKEGEDWYLYTQLEPLDARRAFPCFDEPSFKVPWQITLAVPKENLAVSNTPIAAESERDGMRSVSFAATAPLPSYLIAFGVGPFDGVDVGKAGRNGTPMRIFTPRGRSAETGWAAQATRELLVVLEDLFDTPYPYEKLDTLVIPHSAAATRSVCRSTRGRVCLSSETNRSPARTDGAARDARRGLDLLPRSL